MNLSDRADPLDFDLQPLGSTQVFYYATVLSHLDDVSRCAFAVATPYTVRAPHHGYAALTANTARPPQVDSRPGDTPLLRAVEELKTWLRISYDDLARILGWQSASTIHHWRRCARDNDPVQPRAASVEPILRLHALLKAVAETVSGDPLAVELWARTPLTPDGPKPLDLLEQGRVDEVEQLAAGLLFGPSARAVPAWRQVRPTDDDELPTSNASDDYGADDFG